MSKEQKHVRPNRPSRQAGFTVIEAVVVIALSGILVSIAAPRFLDLDEWNAAQVHRQALADLRYAQRRAMSSGCPVQVDFTTTGYILTQRTGCRSGTYTQPLVDPVTHQTPYSVSISAGMTLTSSIDPMVFDAVGRITTTAGTTSDATVSIAGLMLEGTGETGLIRVP